MGELMETPDPLCVEDTFVEGISSMTRIGSCIRIEYFVTRASERIVVARIVWPAALAIEASMKFRQFIDSTAQAITDLPIGLIPH